MTVTVEKTVPGEDAVPALVRALALAAARKSPRIRFLPGRYDFYPGRCARLFRYFSNNDCGMKTVALHLADKDDVEIAGEDTLLFFHGRISPLLAENCSRLRISGITVDFEESFVSDARIVRTENGFSHVKLNGGYRLDGGRLRFIGDEYDNRSGVLQIRPFDPATGEMPHEADCTNIPNRGIREENGLVLLPAVFDAPALTIRHEDRLCPGIVLSDCSGVTVENVTVRRAAGMGLLAQFCRDVTLERVRVVPAADRAVSSSDDALHFVECRGRISIRNCRASGMLDDALNVHGIYRPVTIPEADGNSLYLETGHFQQAGLPGARPGDTLEFVRPASGRPLGTVEVSGVKAVTPERTRVFFSGPLPPDVRSGDGARVLEAGTARLEVSGCDFAPLRGRGVLASGLESVDVSHCRFHTSGAAVFIAGGCRRWYETGPVRHAVIRDNLFDNCCYLRHSSTAETVSVYPDMEELEPDFHYHGLIEVKNNRFVSQKRPQIAVLSAERAEISGNTLEINDRYPVSPHDPGIFSFAGPDSKSIIFKHVGTAEVRDNDGFF
ncbi:MAG: right-handed parallel beta-helix repeat-containing protein [Lentisphaeria bacterium]|nr:right-handed parallel beta-helix repeat-containing protein [Lentisphaeria bacterium]